ncbi:MAG: glycerol-3-phosphate acyltransferase [Anaerolineae bacterium]|jgi:glycerol-3-phosphate acyltransferase PlsY
MEWYVVLLAALIGYLLGSISFARVLMRIVAPEEDLTGLEFVDSAGEVRQVDTIGGTAVSMKLGAKYGGITAILDILKVFVPTLAFRLLYPDTPYHLIAAILGLIGHNWPIYYRFKGGSGMSAMIGGFLAVDPIGTLVTSVAGMFLGMVVLRQIFLSYLLGSWLMIPWLGFFTRDPVYLIYAIVVNGIFVLGLLPGIRSERERRRQGIESDFDEGMDATPMGRMIKKMGARVGLFRE